ISQRNREWDDMLRIETLRFLHTFTDRAIAGGIIQGRDDKGRPMIADFVNQDGRVRWVHRFFARGNTKKSIRIACKLLENHPKWGEFWKARVMVTLGAGLQRLGEVEAKDKLEAALRILEQIDLEDEDSWVYRHTEATALLYLGLQERAEGGFSRAGKSYEKAREIFEKNGEPAAVARTLTNLSYVLIRQGKATEAAKIASEAARRRRELGDVVGMALSLNTRAIAENWAGEKRRARRLARQALEILRSAQEMGYPHIDRELALVYLSLGNITRYLTRNNSFRSSFEVENDWVEAENYLKKALEREQVLEPYYKFELYNRFGRLYTDWANWLAISEISERSQERYLDFMKRADRNFKIADQIAVDNDWDVRQAENFEDWAWVFHIRQANCCRMCDKEFSPVVLEQKTLALVADAEELIRNKITRGQTGSLAYYVAGSIYHQLGRYYHKFTEEIDKAAQNYALSVANYDMFSNTISRREIVMAHIEDVIYREGASFEHTVNSIESMLHILDERNLPAKRLRKYLADTREAIGFGVSYNG
ncbi:MAG: tetratricopeptide repeat protein, partial [Anaerolineae bacterium]|nr:tetratricopeptide repeat protein [Anaerolineae bacterium]